MRIGTVLTVLLPSAMLLGLGFGTLFHGSGEELGVLIDPLVLTLLTLIFFEVRFARLRIASDQLTFLFLAWVTNFILIPILSWGLASSFFSDQPALFTGLFLYLLFPCTDWFLAFTRIAKGDVPLGSILIPINLISQLFFFPIYLAMFISSETSFEVVDTWRMFWQWFLIPFLGGFLIRFILSSVLSSDRLKSVTTFAGSLIPWFLSALVFCIFSCHTLELAAYSSTFPFILLAIFLFFFATWLMGEFFKRFFRFTGPQHTLFAMTTTARNSPLMLGLATIALPDQPMIYAVLIIGMLVEFPHLTFLSRIVLVPNNSLTTSVTKSVSL